MKVLIVGSGGREHAIAASVAKSPRADKIYCAPGNAGIAEYAECVDIGPMEFDKLAAFAKEKEIDLCIVGMDDPLVGGLVDILEQRIDQHQDQYLPQQLKPEDLPQSADQSHVALPRCQKNRQAIVAQRRGNCNGMRGGPAEIHPRRARFALCQPWGRTATLSTGMEPKWVSSSPSDSSRRDSTVSRE